MIKSAPHAGALFPLGITISAGETENHFALDI